MDQGGLAVLQKGEFSVTFKFSEVLVYFPLLLLNTTDWVLYKEKIFNSYLLEAVKSKFGRERLVSSC